MSNQIKEPLSEETKNIWDKMTIFKQRYKEYSNKVKSLEEALAVVNLELSLTKNENARMKEELNMKHVSIIKYQQILKDMVEVEDRYCKLLQERTCSDKELAAEKKLRLDLERKHEDEKNKIQQSMQEELRILKEDSLMKEEATIIKYSQTIEEQNKEIDNLKQKLAENEKKYEEHLLNMRKDLQNAVKEIDDLKGDACRKEIPFSNNAVNKKVSISDDELIHSTYGAFKIMKGESVCSKAAPNKFLSIAKQGKTLTDLIPATSFYPPDLCSPRQLAIADTSVPSPSTKSTVAGFSQKNQIEVFCRPARVCNKKSPVRKKIKLYSRSDDTL